MYKVALNGYATENYIEYDKIINPTVALPRNVFYPEVNLFHVDGQPVLAMEYIEGETIAECFCLSYLGEECNETCMTMDEVEMLSPIMDDPCGMNAIRTYESTYYIIDAA